MLRNGGFKQFNKGKSGALAAIIGDKEFARQLLSKCILEENRIVIQACLEEFPQEELAKKLMQMYGEVKKEAMEGANSGKTAGETVEALKGRFEAVTRAIILLSGRSSEATGAFLDFFLEQDESLIAFEIALKAGRREVASDCLHRLLEVEQLRENPGFVSLLANYAAIYGDSDLAVKLLIEYEQGHGKSASPEILAWLQIGNGKLDEVWSGLDETAEGRPWSAAAIACWTGDLKRAFAYLGRAPGGKEDNTEAPFSFASYCMKAMDETRYVENASQASLAIALHEALQENDKPFLRAILKIGGEKARGVASGIVNG
jgi:hypothetical protein